MVLAGCGGDDCGTAIYFMKTLIALLLAPTCLAFPPIDKVPVAQVSVLCAQWNDMPNHYAGYVAGTGSMYPRLLAGDMMLCDKAAAKVGDLVVYARADGLRVIHEIIAIKGTRFLAQGTNNLYPDEWQDLTQIEGVARRVIRVNS